MKMKSSWLAACLLSSMAGMVTASSPTQFCVVKEETKTDLCFAVASSKNATTQANDLSLHVSARFVVDATGWAAVGIGAKMDKALMFVMYPGGEQGRVTVSIRTTMFHDAPQIASAAPETHVSRTWIGEDGLHNAQIVCYGCESWTDSKLDVMSADQPWIWAFEWKQQTHSDDVHMRLHPHTDRGFAKLNMASSYSASGENIALVATQRISQVAESNNPGPAPAGHADGDDDHHPAKEHHKHSLFGLVSIHGFLLALGFFVLTFGVLGIRSGRSNSYKIHWVIQTAAGSAIMLGCLMGIYLSYKHNSKFKTWHQWIGLSIMPSMVFQGILGYVHHLNYLKYGRRTAVSYYHLWIGRIILLIGNLNVGFGLNLAHSDSFKWFIWYAGLIIQLSVLIPMWYFYIRGKTILDAVRGKPKYEDGVGYDSVEQEAFIVDDELDDLVDEEHDGKKSTSKDH